MVSYGMKKQVPVDRIITENWRRILTMRKHTEGVLLFLTIESKWLLIIFINTCNGFTTLISVSVRTEPEKQNQQEICNKILMESFVLYEYRGWLGKSVVHRAGCREGQTRTPRLLSQEEFFFNREASVMSLRPSN